MFFNKVSEHICISIVVYWEIINFNKVNCNILYIIVYFYQLCSVEEDRKSGIISARTDGLTRTVVIEISAGTTADM